MRLARPVLLAAAWGLSTGCPSGTPALAVGYSSAGCAWTFEEGREPALRPLAVGSKLTLPLFGFDGGLNCRLTGKIPTPTCDGSFNPTGVAAVSGAPDVVSAAVVDGLVVVTALKAGTATVRITSAEVATPAEAVIVVVEPKPVWTIDAAAVTAVGFVDPAAEVAVALRLTAPDGADACPAGLAWSIAGRSLSAALTDLVRDEERAGAAFRASDLTAAQGAAELTVGATTYALPFTRLALDRIDRLEGSWTDGTLSARAFAGETRAFGASFLGRSLTPDVVRFAGGVSETAFGDDGVALEPAKRADGSPASGPGRLSVSLPGAPAAAVEVAGSL